MSERAASPKPPPAIDNRRNYYRVLHVQPEAPAEVIKASYRTLMMRMKGHPDLGGSHAEAAMINEAWAVLGDPERRAAYDRLLRRRGFPLGRAEQSGFRPMGPAGVAASAARPAGPRGGAAAAPSAGAGPGAAGAQAPAASGPARGSRSAEAGSPKAGMSAAAAEAPAAASATARAAAAAASAPAAMAVAVAVEAVPPRPACALCGESCSAHPAVGERCLRCHAPLHPMPAPGSPGHELLGRRGALRRAKDHVAGLRIGWPAPELPVRWRDLSLTGLSLFTPQPVPVGQRILVVDPALETVAEVVACRPQGRLYTVHARLLTVLLLQPTGVFVSAQA